MRKADTDRVREGISEGCRSGEPEGRSGRRGSGYAAATRRRIEPQQEIPGNGPPRTELIGLPYSAALHGWQPVPLASRPSRDALVRP